MQMATKNNIPTGYKNSAVGIIPQEWEVKRLGTIAKCFSGGTPKSESEEMYGGTIPFIRSGEIHGDKTALYLTDDGLRKSSAKMVDVGDLIFALYGANSGDCAISQINGAINQAILCIRSSSVINSFLQPYLELQKDRFIAKYLQGGQGNLSGEIVSSYTIPVPPIGEQRKIAEILGVWDEAIEKQSRLIERLEVRKRALMQRLLTGRTRLPGFTTPWQKIKLGEICQKVTRRNSKNNTNVMTISAQRGFVSQTDFFNKSVASETLDNYYLVYRDEFCYNKSYSNGYPMGAIKRLKEADKAVVTTLYICFCLNCSVKVDIDFFEQYCENGGFNQNLMKVANEGGRAHGLLNVTPSDFFGLQLLLPSLPEQKAIAEVLTTADDEIATHRKKLDALRLQKRGLMQQLLTGKTRVKI